MIVVLQILLNNILEYLYLLYINIMYHASYILININIVSGGSTEHSENSLSVFDISKIAATASLIFAVATYWYNKYRKRIEKKTLLNKLDQEMKKLFKSLCANILKYKIVRQSNYMESFTVNVYYAPILVKIVESGELHKYIHHDEGYSRAMNVYTIVKLIDNCDKSGFSPPIMPQAIDWFFNNRLLVLRDDIVALYRCRCLDKMVVTTDDVKILSDQVMEFLQSLDDS